MTINYFAILVCGLASIIIGALWYSKILFGNLYIKATGMDIGMTPEKMAVLQKKMWQLYLAQVIVSVWEAYVLAYFIKGWDSVNPVMCAFWIWAGFILPTIATLCLWSGYPRKNAWKIFFITAGCQLVTFIVFALILGNL